MLTRGMVAEWSPTALGGRFARKLFGLPRSTSTSYGMALTWRRCEKKKTATKRIEPRTEFFKSPAVKIASLVGMVRPQKDYLLALRVAQALHRIDPQWRVLFVGDCLPHTKDYADQVRSVWREFGLENVVAFAGLRWDAVEIIRQSSVLFSTSLFEGCPNVVLEAMAVGTPAVGT